MVKLICAVIKKKLGGLFFSAAAECRRLIANSATKNAITWPRRATNENIFKSH